MRVARPEESPGVIPEITQTGSSPYQALIAFCLNHVRSSHYPPPGGAKAPDFAARYVVSASFSSCRLSPREGLRALAGEFRLSGPLLTIAVVLLAVLLR